MEIEMGSFCNDTEDDCKVEMYLKEANVHNVKHSLIIEVIELRPKDLGV